MEEIHKRKNTIKSIGAYTAGLLSFSVLLGSLIMYSPTSVKDHDVIESRNSLEMIMQTRAGNCSIFRNPNSHHTRLIDVNCNGSLDYVVSTIGIRIGGSKNITKPSNEDIQKYESIFAQSKFYESSRK